MPRTTRQLHLATILWLATLTGQANADEIATLTTEIQKTDTTTALKSPQRVVQSIASDFESLAGSPQNASSLVTGLRGGTSITLTQPGEPTATFTPPTRPMGYGNVSISLGLARTQLAQQGITNPTPSQLQTALMGGSITANGTTVQYPGILQQRADGLGWGQIAHSMGTKLGPVISGIHAQNARLATLPAAPSGGGVTPIVPHAVAPKGLPEVVAPRRGNGVVTAAGTPAGAANAAHGKAHARGIDTPPGHARGHAIVTAAGGPGVPVSAAGMAPGRGAIVTGAGASASAPGAAVAAGAARGGIVTSAGGAPGNSAAGEGNGRALGHAK